MNPIIDSLVACDDVQRVIRLLQRQGVGVSTTSQRSTSAPVVRMTGMALG
jgi:hypothetical protein